MARRRAVCEEAQARMRLRAASVEKDFWVCWTLRELFNLPYIGPRLTFKGGTSLSKAWKLIERFSEDIDVVIDRDFLGYGGDASPEAASSRKKRSQALDALRDSCQAYIRDSLAPALSARIAQALGPGGWQLESDPADADGQTLLFRYPAAFDGGGYVAPVVKIEMGARSDIDPAEAPQIEPYLAQTFPDLLGESRFAVRTLSARRTFWEKAMLLHEETYRPAEKRRGMFLSRHYYDLWCMIRLGVAEQAIASEGLFERIAAHREVFFRYNWLDYKTLHRGSLRLMPLREQFPAWQRDYDDMREAMFFGATPPFLEVLTLIEDFQNKFNQT
ncbi:MAG: nucleotidyl transferase AbiEii/AbiGii toxin family protein [Burkholderiales bacterium]